eukprot:CAMPEP_0194210184 /NCGR_PEP_ID=MMETSP0156-20130528/8067_1 /TAXON_ID=33649 /ORGANISM="Thalassionema nitzschioides, Strain L26-B" /LENGTH=262 /DNA_ID=CAMNT_0038937499 /DNA_START=62 /DNA_END=847 /DNA_ORIENTATION=+
MSLRGRQWLDRLNQSLQTVRLRLPSPPYGNPHYWNVTYKDYQHNPSRPSLQTEWGHLTLPEDLMQYEYQLLDGDDDNNDKSTSTSTTWEETVAIDPELSPNNDDERKKQNTIMMLGCGYSKLGPDMMQHPGWKNMTQVDICSKVISDLTPPTTDDDKSISFNDAGDYIEDDANHLSAFGDNTMDAIIDKGLLDSLHLDFLNGTTQIPRIMDSVARVLKPNGIFIFFSLSYPKYLFPSPTANSNDDDSIRIVKQEDNDDNDVW